MRFAIRCDERRGAVVRRVQEAIKTDLLYDWLWEHIQGIPNFLRNDPADLEKGEMVWWLEQHTTHIYLVDTVGAVIVLVQDPAVTAHVHITFWDKILVGREELCRELSRRVLREKNLSYLHTSIPIGARATMAFARRVGFKPVMLVGNIQTLVLIGDDVGLPNYTV